MALSSVPTAFSGNPLNRADHLREDPEIFGAYMEREDARVVLFAIEGERDEGNSSFLPPNDYWVLTDEPGDIAWQKPSAIRLLPKDNTIFLGLDENGAPRFAVKLGGTTTDFAEFFEPQGQKFRDGRNIAHKLTNPPSSPHPSLGIIAQAKSMLMWHDSHRFCAKCGEESEMIKAGYERECPACKAHHFPRTDPVVIMLVRCGDKALVGRGKGWPEGNFSALAGYMEPGESMEEAVAREVFEEVGLKTTHVRYVASQPWPWPSTLMIGVEAWVEDGEITLQEAEIAEALWITKDDVRASMKGESPYRLVPPPFAIAHNLVKNWMDE
ncbi:NAD(+) diphosphatase [Kordiimonas lacus]|uniref:NAD(+) diphosphatase n=1 Tax=Kordiimonas lacus TaxID=637679 RepID=A0A1G6XKV3_9PROT|nr:NAD(+) diphosphatase [Kordiimonas lacus]SDD78838.1 NAD+ diphosphatase [Kordiimonas lacus]